jgi:AbrB family looped-hinge helix DNA binding protein
MNARVTIDKAGRLVLPKGIRQALRIGAGDVLDVTSDEDRIVLSAVRIPPGLSKERGVWVYRSGQHVDCSIPELIDRQRTSRIKEII